ncbi:SDR family oxidoreductase [Pseudonocardia alni]|uniref:SDR family oxidoreductase n=1 Tax=Pseudonocardia alni TaxID=33907 RepID=UPI0034043D53
MSQPGDPFGPDPFRLDGTVAAVTGSNRGIGRALAVGLAAAGSEIVHLNRSDSAEVIEQIADAGGASTHVPYDLSADPARVEDVVEQAISWRGHLDVLVNSAGRVVRAPALEQRPEELIELLQVDLHAPMLLSRAVGRHMVERGSGRIINIASLMSFQGGNNVAGYAAAKSGLAGLTRAFANEWGRHGVTVNAIAPGYIATDINEDLWSDPERHSELLARIPAGRWGSPRDLAGAAVFLASPAAAYVNGHVLAVDGGWLSR